MILDDGVDQCSCDPAASVAWVDAQVDELDHSSRANIKEYVSGRVAVGQGKNGVTAQKAVAECFIREGPESCLGGAVEFEQ